MGIISEKSRQALAQFSEERRRKQEEDFSALAKRCEWCKELIPFPANSSFKRVSQKRFCNRKCSSAFKSHAIALAQTKGHLLSREKRKKGDNPGGPRKNRSDAWWSARLAIAFQAQRTYRRSKKPKHCVICSYDKHYEVHHIRGWEKFGNEATMAEINHLDNLVALCPNHHWEADRGLITSDDLKVFSQGVGPDWS